LIAAVSTLPASAASPAAEPAPLVGTSSAGAIAGEYLVVLKDASGLRAAGLDGSSASTIVADAVSRGTKVGATIQERYTNALQGYAAAMSPAALAQVREDPAVAYVQANQTYQATQIEATGTEADPTWGLDRVDQRNLPLNSKYYYTNSGTGVTAYVVDTGIRASHLDFTTDAAGNAIPSRVTSGVDVIGGGLASCDPNSDFEAGHGTHVAGILGGVYYGVAKNVSLVSVRVLDCSGSTTSAKLAKGLDWIVANHTSGPAVANLSLSNNGSGADRVIEAAVKRLIADKVTVVIAAGNGDRNGNGANACSFSPGDVKTAITVGSTTKSDRRSTFSNYGSCVDLYAPGSDIESDWFSADNTAATMSGTSMATPYVAGAVALYLQLHPKATPATVQAAMLKTSTPNKVANVSHAWPRRLLFALQRVSAPAATTTASQIPSGQALLLGQRICSSNKLYCLTQRTSDGKLVLYKPGNRVLWHTGAAAAWTKMNAGGDLVSYDIYNRATWTSGTGTAGASTLRVQDNGTLAIVNNASQAVVWTSNAAQSSAPTQTKNAASSLVTGTALYRSGARLHSANGKFSFGVASNGALVLTKMKVGIIWHTGAKDSDWLTIGTDGNLVLYRSDSVAVWKTGTTTGAARLSLLNNGNLVLERISDHKTLWSTKTAGA
jgi:subtilisin family serine protease